MIYRSNTKDENCHCVQLNATVEKIYGTKKDTKYAGKSHADEDPYASVGRPPSKAICGPLIYHGHPGAFRNQNFTEFLLTVGPNQTMRKSPTTSDSRSMSQSSKQEGSYQTTSKKTKVDKQFTSRVSTLRTKPCPNAQDVQTNEVSTRSLLWASRTRKRRINKLSQTLNGRVICFDAHPKKYVKNVIQIRDTTETCSRIRGAVTSISSTRTQVRASMLKGGGVSVMQGLSEKISCWRKPYAR